MSSFLNAIEALNKSKARYAIVGGFAGVMHGNNRFTADLDVVVDIDSAASRRVIDELMGAGFKATLKDDPHLFSDPLTREKWRKEKNVRVFSLYDPTNPTFAVDLFLEPPLPFEQLMKNAVTITLRGNPCSVCALSDLVTMKEMAGRPQDKLDLEVLKILQTRNKLGPHGKQ